MSSECSQNISQLTQNSNSYATITYPKTLQHIHKPCTIHSCMREQSSTVCVPPQRRNFVEEKNWYFSAVARQSRFFSRTSVVLSRIHWITRRTKRSRYTDKYKKYFIFIISHFYSTSLKKKIWANRGIQRSCFFRSQKSIESHTTYHKVPSRVKEKKNTQKKRSWKKKVYSCSLSAGL